MSENPKFEGFIPSSRFPSDVVICIGLMAATAICLLVIAATALDLIGWGS